MSKYSFLTDILPLTNIDLVRPFSRSSGLHCQVRAQSILYTEILDINYFIGAQWLFKLFYEDDSNIYYWYHVLININILHTDMQVTKELLTILCTSGLMSSVSIRTCFRERIKIKRPQTAQIPWKWWEADSLGSMEHVLEISHYILVHCMHIFFQEQPT